MISAEGWEDRIKAAIKDFHNMPPVQKYESICKFYGYDKRFTAQFERQMERELRALACLKTKEEIDKYINTLC